MALATPYLLFLGDVPDALSAKVAQGIRDWRPELCVGQYRMPGCKADVGLKDLDIDAAVAAGARTLVVGAANRGGVINPAWKKVFLEALDKGLDIASGLHELLTDDESLVKVARDKGRQLTDVRIPTESYPIADGVARRGLRCLTVGTDCSVGKMYTTLALERAMHARGMAATFRATGQTGILITGEGVPLDAVVADFMAGSIEHLTPPAEDDQHWDLIEGQGSLFHASYSGVTLALIHGGAPDALVLCHEPTRTHMRGLPNYSLPTLENLRETAVAMARVVNPKAQAVGVAINTKALDADAARNLCERTEAELGLPTVDPFRDGADRLAEALQNLSHP
jgi:uncharacterized NAD-dependent epimerase/dehydratase family protein